MVGSISTIPATSPGHPAAYWSAIQLPTELVTSTYGGSIPARCNSVRSCPAAHPTLTLCSATAGGSGSLPPSVGRP